MAKTGRDWKAIREHHRRALEAFNAPPTMSGQIGSCPRDGYDMREKPGAMESVCCYCGYTISYDDALDYYASSSFVGGILYGD
jgi:hypothetical protein